MLRLAADENFNSDIVRGLLRQRPNLDIVRVQDVGLSGADDRTVLAWAAGQGRVLLTHDVTTLTRHAYDRARAGESMPEGHRFGPRLMRGARPATEAEPRGPPARSRRGAAPGLQATSPSSPEPPNFG